MRAWVVWSAGLLAYIVAVLDRTTLGVAGLDAAKRFGAAPAVLSTFVVLQLVVYAGAQIPAGLLLDRFGSKKMILTGGLLMLAGQLMMAFTTSLPIAIAARAVVGLGDAFTFISVVRLVPHWFPPRQVPLVTQLTGISGQLGQVLSAVPFLGLMASAGWTKAFTAVAILGVVSLMVTALLLSNAPGNVVVDDPKTDLRATLRSVKTVWMRPGTRLGFFTHMGTQFSVTVFALFAGAVVIQDVGIVRWLMVWSRIIPLRAMLMMPPATAITGPNTAGPHMSAVSAERPSILTVRTTM